MRKKIVCLILGITLLGSLLAGCGNEDTAPAPPQQEEESGTQEEESVTEVTEAAGEMLSGESIQTNGGETISLASLEHQDETSDTIVYYTSDISPEAMVAAYDALGTELTGESIAVKLSTGEPPASNYLDPDLIADLVHQVNGTIVENNTAYGGQRSSTAMHYQVAEDHGFTDIADFVVLDEDGSVSFRKILWERIFPNMTVIWYFLTLKDMPWQVSAVPSKIFPSAWLPRRASV